MMSVLRGLAIVCLVLGGTMAVSDSQAGVVLNGTRFVYPSPETEIGVKVMNQGKNPVLVKSWIDRGDASALPEEIKVPFTLTPPIVRLDADKDTALRLAYTGDASLPIDRESLFWLNVMEVPPRPSGKTFEGQHTMQLAFRYRLKLFFRPEGLSGSAEEAAKALTWALTESRDRPVLKVTNQRPYYVSLAKVALTYNGQTVAVEPETIAPFSSHEFVLPESAQRIANDAADSVDYRWINEWGGVVDSNKPTVRQ